MNMKMTAFLSILTVISGTAYGDFHAAFTEGRKAFSEKQYDAAIQKYDEAAKQTAIPGQRYQALFAKAEACRMKGDWVNAEKILVQIMEDKDIPAQNRMSAQIAAGDYALKQKKYDDAIAAYQKAASYGIQNNESNYALLSCGNLYSQQKKYDDAKRCYQSLLDNPQTDANRRNRAMVGMGNILYEQGKYREAIVLLKPLCKGTDVQAAVKADAFIITARSHYRQKDFKKACDVNLAIIGLDNIPAYYKAAAYMQAISIQCDFMKRYLQAKKLLDDFEKMPGVNASQKKWIKDYRAKVRKGEHTL